ncbi:MAG TPA: calcium-binding protein [Beijerinckiaceae bacterium]|jgi:Ca2+-binding RTX toxin-like protein
MAVPTFFGPETLVNLTTSASQSTPDVAALANGKYVVVWADFSSGDNFDVVARIFNADGSPATREIAINAPEPDFPPVYQDVPVVAALSDGRFVVAWEQHTAAFDSHDIRARIFNGNGTPAGAEFVVNTTLAGNQRAPDIAALAGGGFVIAWEHFSGTNDDIRARAFNAAGSALGAEFVVEADAVDETQPAIAGLSNGDYAIVWRDTGSAGEHDGSGWHIRGEVFRGNGTGVSGEFIVNSTTAGNQAEPSIAALPNGRFVVTWTHFGATWDVRARVFANGGAPLAPDFVVDAEGDDEFAPTVTALPDNRFFIVWHDDAAGTETDGSTTHLRGELFSGVTGNGGSSANEFVVNTTTAQLQIFPSVATLVDGRLIAAWEDESRTAPDTSASAVRAQLLDPRTVGVTLVGANLGDDWVGTPFADVMRGGAGRDRLNGRGGNDRLDGQDGNDLLLGGSRNDVLIGRDGRDRLDSGDGNDVLLGGAGHDVLLGGAGNDRLDGQTDNDGLFGGSGNDVLQGGNGNDRLFGNTGRDALIGGAGGDRLNGSAGKDKLIGGSGADIFLFNTALNAGSNVDLVTDFSTAEDRIGLDNAVFTGLPVGTLSASAFRVGAAAADASDRVIYNSTTGALLFDEDGAGGAAAVKFAQLDPGLALNRGDFLVF